MVSENTELAHTLVVPAKNFMRGIVSSRISSSGMNLDMEAGLCLTGTLTY